MSKSGERAKRIEKLQGQPLGLKERRSLILLAEGHTRGKIEKVLRVPNATLLLIDASAKLGAETEWEAIRGLVEAKLQATALGIPPAIEFPDLPALVSDYIDVPLIRLDKEERLVINALLVTDGTAAGIARHIAQANITMSQDDVRAHRTSAEDKWAATNRSHLGVIALAVKHGVLEEEDPLKDRWLTPVHPLFTNARERAKVLQLRAEGKSPQQIDAILGIPPERRKSRISASYKDLKTTDPIEVIRLVFGSLDYFVTPQQLDNFVKNLQPQDVELLEIVYQGAKGYKAIGESVRRSRYTVRNRFRAMPFSGDEEIDSSQNPNLFIRKRLLYTVARERGLISAELLPPKNNPEEEQ